MSDNIFEGATTPPVVEPVSAPASQVPPELVELVGEGKKYRSVDDALKSVPHAQGHIQKLEEETKLLKEELAKRKAAEELLEELRVTGLPKGEGTPTQPPSVDPEMISKTVAQLLEQREAQSTAKANLNKVVSSFTETFGDKAKAEEMYNKVATESGLSVAQLNQLAASSPEAVLRLAGLTKQKGAAPVAKVASSVNTEAFSSQAQPSDLSARVRQGASTKDLMNAWRIAGQKIGKPV